ncbi:MAG: MFS transporter [Pseudomonadota bacterium]
MSSTLGNVLEWYDFAVYGSMAPLLGKLFFPGDDPVASLLATFGVFALGYIARPVGGVLLGHVGDKFGRKRALILSVLLMGLGTTLIGLLPTHAAIGTAAAGLLVLLRVLQGLSAGGEYPSSIVFLAEHAPVERRGYFASWPVAASCGGFLLGSAVVTLLTNGLGEAAMADWGWRIPFLLGAAIALCGAYYRRNLSEPKALAQATALEDSPIIATVRHHWRSVVRIIAITLVNAVGFYLLWVYAISYLTDQMHVSTATAMDVNTISLAVMIPTTILAGMLADKIGRKPLLYFVALGTIFLAWPLWWLMHHDSFVLILTAQMGFMVLYSAGYAALSAVMVEVLPAGVRCSASALGYNLCMGLFGGTTPLVATYLVQRTADDFAPAYFLIATGVLSLIATFGLKETAQQKLKH